ncbi:MAG: hypothetical protein HY275_04575 [Gemmatimonadetes bacterium]|nr:hypothetical protein [Gemmatimonadota bacterium]
MALATAADARGVIIASRSLADADGRTAATIGTERTGAGFGLAPNREERNARGILQRVSAKLTREFRSDFQATDGVTAHLRLAARLADDRVTPPMPQPIVTRETPQGARYTFSALACVIHGKKMARTSCESRASPVRLACV